MGLRAAAGPQNRSWRGWGAPGESRSAEFPAPCSTDVPQPRGGKNAAVCLPPRAEQTVAAWALLAPQGHGAWSARSNLRGWAPSLVPAPPGKPELKGPGKRTHTVRSFCLRILPSRCTCTRRGRLCTGPHSGKGCSHTGHHLQRRGSGTRAGQQLPRPWKWLCCVDLGTCCSDGLNKPEIPPVSPEARLPPGPHFTLTSCSSSYVML